MDIKEKTSPNTHKVAAELLFEEANLRRVLDIPCGEGAFAKRLLERGIEVSAADLVDEMKVSGAQFAVCDMNEPLPYRDGEFDAVVCIDGIEHIERPFDFVRECGRVLRGGGILVLSTPNISALRSRWRWLLTGFHNKGKSPLDEGKPSPLHHISMLSFPALRYLLHTNGFRIEAVRANRIKAISWAYAPLVPLAYLVTRHVFHREEKDPGQRERNREILRRMFSRDVLFGETLIVKAVREQN
jgi:SAM-dependent methyltransferase